MSLADSWGAWWLGQKDEGGLCWWVGLYSKGKMCWVMFRWLDLTLPCPGRGAGSVSPDPYILVSLAIIPGNSISGPNYSSVSGPALVFLKTL